MSDCCCCSNGKCNCPCHRRQEEETCHTREHQGDMCDWLIEAADAAWMEVLQDKIKEHILATQNDRMTELAKIVSEANNQRWKLKMEKQHNINGFHEELCRFFSQHRKK